MKIYETKDGYLGLMCKDTDLSTDGTSMTASGIISTQSVDRSKDIVIADGGLLDNHKSNPLVMLDHWRPIGKAEDANGNYTVIKGTGVLTSTTHFCQKIPEAVQTFELVHDGILRGMSIGFRSKRSVPLEDGTSWPGRQFEEWELIEYSHCWIPDNPEALVDALQKKWDGRPLDACIVKSLERHLPPDTAATVALGGKGFDVDGVAKAVAAKLKEFEHRDEFEALDEPADADDDGMIDTENETEKETNDVTFDGPAGAQFLAGLHMRVMDTLDFVKTEGSEDKQEKAQLLEAIADTFLPMLEELLKSTNDLHTLLYPKRDELQDNDEKATEHLRRKRLEKVAPSEREKLLSVVEFLESNGQSDYSSFVKGIAERPDDHFEGIANTLAEKLKQIKRAYDAANRGGSL